MPLDVFLLLMSGCIAEQDGQYYLLMGHPDDLHFESLSCQEVFDQDVP